MPGKSLKRAEKENSGDTILNSRSTAKRVCAPCNATVAKSDLGEPTNSFHIYRSPRPSGMETLGQGFKRKKLSMVYPELPV